MAAATASRISVTCDIGARSVTPEIRSYTLEHTL
jgi:hypothetical protein